MGNFSYELSIKLRLKLNVSGNNNNYIRSIEPYLQVLKFFI